MTQKAIIKRLNPSRNGMGASYLLADNSWSGTVPWDTINRPVRLFGDTVQALEHLENISKPDDTYVIEFAFTKE